VSQSKLDHVAIVQPEDGQWQWLYKVGGTAALITVVFFRRNLGAELVGFKGFGIIKFWSDLSWSGELPQRST